MSRLKERQLNTDSVIHRQEYQHLTICQLNIPSLPAHFQDLESCKSLTDCDIIGLAETWLHPGKIYTIIVSSQIVECATIKVVLHCMSSLR